jgi:endonuclease/exonuclease/phosphatase family metal-dependent hydrolase
MSKPTCRTLSILSWNVWFDYHELQSRSDLIIMEIVRMQPDIICLQEVLPLFESNLSRHRQLQALYQFSKYEPGHGYGNITLVKKNLRPQFTSVPLPTKMGRKLTVARVLVGDSNQVEMVIGNVHLESLENNQLIREQQLQVCNEQLPAGMSVLAGDFNIPGDDAKYRLRVSQGRSSSSRSNSSSSGSDSGRGEFKSMEVSDRRHDRKDSSKSSTKDSLPNEIVLRALPDFTDAWHQQAVVVGTLLQMRDDTGATYLPDDDFDLSGDTADGMRPASLRTNRISRKVYQQVDELGYTYDEAVSHPDNKTVIQRSRIDRILTSLDTKRFEFVNLTRVGTSIHSTTASGRVHTIFPADHFGLLYTCLVHLNA